MNFVESEATESKTDIVSANEVETIYAYNENDVGETIVVPSASQGEDKNEVRLVQIRFPTSVDRDGRSWLSLVQNT